MPLVKISILENWTDKEKEELNDKIHNSLKSILKIHDWDFFHRIYEFKKSNFHIPDGKSEKYIYLEIHLFPGRKRETKKVLYKDIVKNLGEMGIPKNDIIIQIIESRLENWGISGGTIADEFEFDYKLDV